MTSISTPENVTEQFESSFKPLLVISLTLHSYLQEAYDKVRELDFLGFDK